MELTNADRCRLYYRRHRASRIAHQKSYYRLHRDERLEYARAYGLVHADKRMANARTYRAANIERLREHDRCRAKTVKHRQSSLRFYHKNKPLLRARYNATRQKTVAAAKALFKNRCLLCGYGEHPEILQFDHVMPLTKSGRSRANSDRNIAAPKFPEKFQLLCPNCHAIKTLLWKRVYPPTKYTLKAQRYREATLRMFGARCNICGHDECVLVLQFDHVVAVRNSKGRSGTGLVCEARKHPERFQLLCANCHALKTIVDRRRSEMMVNQVGNN